MKIIVTGGCGLIGSHLCARLIKEGHTVTCLDNLSTGNFRNFREISTHHNFCMVHHDICDNTVYIEADQIYNLACPASPIHYQRDPIKTMMTNVIGSRNMLDLARHTGARILQASTSEIYGDPNVHPQTESYHGNVNPIGPRACYDEGKRAAEALFFDYARMYNVNIRIARIFNTYGPHMAIDDGRVISNFIVAALLNKPIVIQGNGSHTRSFCHVSDTVDALILLMNTKLHVPPVNVGMPSETKIKSLAKLIKEITGSKSTINFTAEATDDPKMRCPNISLAKSVLGWEPKISLEQGLVSTVEDLKCRLLT